MKRNKMKKIVALVAVLFSVISPVQSHAAAGERIVIIDSYFNKAAISGSIEFVCVASDRCVNSSTSYAHGTQMALIARQQNPDATLVLIQAAPVSKNGSIAEVNLIGLISALDSANNIPGVSAVSFSRFVNNTTAKLKGQCFPPATAPYTPQTGFDKVKSSVVSLNSRGVQVYAAAGNHNNPIDFPACIPDVISVGAGGMGLGGGYHAYAPNPVADIVLEFPNSKQSTSSATVFAASKYRAVSLTASKVVTIL
jgi:hypothetical protein